MRKLLNIELIKLVNSTSFKVILGLHLVLFSLVIFTSSQVELTFPGFDTTNLFKFPYVWSYFAWIASWFNLLLAIAVIMITGNEFSFRTFRQHLIDGLERIELLYGKLVVIFLIALYSFVLVFFSGIIYGSVFTSEFSIINFFSNIDILLVYFLQALGYMVAALMLTVILRSTALSIILFILFRFPIEPVIRSFFDPAIRPFFPMKAIGSLTPLPEFISISSEGTFETAEGGNALSLSEMGLVTNGLPLYGQIFLAAGYIVLFLFITSFALKNRDL